MAQKVTRLVLIAFTIATTATLVFYRKVQQRELPNLIYRKSHKTCSSSWMVWLKENLNPQYCIVASYGGGGHALTRVRTNLNDCRKGDPIAIVDHNDIMKSELRKFNSRRTAIFDSIRDPATRVLSLCKQKVRTQENLSGDEQCLTESSAEFLAYTYPPDGKETRENIIDFYMDCNEVETSICRMQRLLPGALQKKVTHVRKFNKRHQNFTMALKGESLDNLRNVMDQYVKAKLKNGLRDVRTKSKSQKCRVKYKENLSQAQYDGYGRENEKDLIGQL